MRIDPIVCVGAAHWDHIARPDMALAPGGDVPGRIERRPGGVAANIALALAGHGVKVAVVAAVGTDSAGDALAAALAARNVDTSGLIRCKCQTDSFLAIEAVTGALHAAVADCRALQSSGGALAARTAGMAGDIVADGNLDRAALATLLATGRPIAVVAASAAKAARLAPALGAPHATICANRLEASALCGVDFPDSRTASTAISEAGTGAALITDGPRLAAWSGPGGSVALAPLDIPPRSVTGAGDALIAAYLAARRQGLAPEAALRAGLDAAARHAAHAA